MATTESPTKETPEAGFNYMKQAAQAKAATTANALQVHELMDQQSAAYGEAIVSTRAAGAATQAKLSAQNAIDASVDAQVAAMQETLGTDWTSNASASTKWARELQDNTAKAYQALDVVHESQSKTLMNDPLGYLMTQFTLPADVATYNYYAQKAQVAEGALNEVLSASNSAAIAANNMKKLTSTELAIAKSKEAAAASALQVGKLTVDAAGTRIAGVERLQQLSQQQMATVAQVHSMQNDDRRLAMAAEQQAYMREAKKEAQDEKAKKDDDVRAMMEAYNLGVKRTKGAQIGDVAIFRRMLGTINSNPEMAATLVAGQMIQARGGDTTGVPVAATSGEAALLYSNGQADVTSNPVGAFLRDQLQIVRNTPGSPKTKGELAAKVTAVVEQQAKQSMSMIRDNDTNNPYAAPPLPVVAQAKAVQADPFFQKMLAPILVQDKNVTLNNTQILTKALEFSKGSNEDFNTAVSGVVNYYNTAVVLNAGIKQFSENGMPDQKGGFRAVIDGRTYNLQNPVDVKKYLLTSGMNPFDRLFSAGIIAGMR